MSSPLTITFKLALAVVNLGPVMGFALNMGLTGTAVELTERLLLLFIFPLRVVFPLAELPLIVLDLLVGLFLTVAGLALVLAAELLVFLTDSAASKVPDVNNRQPQANTAQQRKMRRLMEVIIIIELRA